MPWPLADTLLSRLRRVTSSGRWIPELDGLRFIAIAGVFLYHLRGYLAAFSSADWTTPVADDWLARVTLHGNLGVPLFFVISGFILGLPFAAHALQGAPRVSLRAYLWRRVTRLEPPYVVTMLLFFALLALTGRRTVAEMLPNLGANLCYLHNLVGPQDGSINGVAWSLEVEVQFYLLAPLLASVFWIANARWRRLVIVGTAYAFVTLQSLVLSRWSLPISLLDHIQFFLMGFLVADLYLVDWHGAPQRSYAWDAVLVGSAVCVVGVAQYGYDWLPWLCPLLMLAFVVAAFRALPLRRLLILPAVTAIGGMCYTIYLIHYQVISAVGRWTRDVSAASSFGLDLIVQSILVGVPLVAVSTVFFLLIEKPCMRKDWPQRAWAWLSATLGPGKPVLPRTAEVR